MRVLVDANNSSAQRPADPPTLEATCALSKLWQKDSVFFRPQNIAKFWNLATRPAEVNRLGFSHEEALHEVASIEDLLTLLPWPHNMDTV
jgi:hypothetical protein